MPFYKAFMRGKYVLRVMTNTARSSSKAELEEFERLAGDLRSAPGPPASGAGGHGGRILNWPTASPKLGNLEISNPAFSNLDDQVVPSCLDSP